jgi:hypothetical protein
VGHGTATAGIIASNGRNLPDRKYRGVAPDAAIISVKILAENVPAHDGEPAETPFYDPARIPIALDFIRDKARELGRPVVMILNLGSQNGPTDGTSALARKIDDMVGPGKPGIVFVSGPGDDGGLANRAGGTVQQGQTAAIEVEKGVAENIRFDLWYAGTDRFDVTVRTPSATRGPFASPATNNDFGSAVETDFSLFHYGSSRDPWGATSDKRELLIDIVGPPGLYVVELRGATVTNGRFDATVNPSTIGNASRANRFRTFVAPGSIWDGATSLYNICPGDYVGRTEYTDIDGVLRSRRSEGNIGELWLGSSTGPTFDGRLGIDVCAPGEVLFTTYDPKSFYSTARFNLIQGGQGHYGLANAVSAAAPIVTGIIALMLELNPQLDAAQVKEILQQTARSDAFTGQTPNPNWGYGKVDAYAALERVAGPVAGPSISGVTLNGKKMQITGVGFGNAPRVLINDVERNSFVTSVSDVLIQIKGKAKKLGIKSGDNAVQVIDSQGAESNRFTLKL